MATSLSPVMDALYHGRAEEAARAVAQVGEGNLTIHEAAAMGVLGRIEQLLAEDPANANAWSPDGFQPLQLAAFFGRPEAAELLLHRGGDVRSASRNAFSVTALHAALAGPTPDIAAKLIAAGADVNATQQDGVTPLQEAAANGREDLTRLLLERGARRDAKDRQGRTAADHARERGHPELAALLEEKS